MDNVGQDSYYVTCEVIVCPESGVSLLFKIATDLSISCSISSSLSRLLQLVSRRLETSLLVTRYREGGCRCWGILLLLLLCSNLLTFSPHQPGVWLCIGQAGRK